MKKSTTRIRAFAIASAMCLTAVGQTTSHNAKASQEYIYNDSNVSLTTAFDRYIATGTGELAQQLQMVVCEELSAQAEADDIQADITNSGTITQVDLSTTGTIEAVAIEEPTTEETTEATTEAVADATEETTEAKPKEEPQDTAQSMENITDYSEYAGKAVITATGVVNIREAATASSAKVGTIRTGGVLAVESRGSEWSLVSSNGVRGYIKNEFMAFDEAAGKYAAQYPNYIAYDSAQAYTEPVAPPPAETPATEASNDTQAPSEEEKPSNIITTATSGFQAVCDYAVQFVGNPYVYGGSSLTEGTDCSGFTMSVYANFGYSLPHSSALQATRGSEVDLSAVSPGDLVFYKNGGATIGHVALYIGNGQVVHASTSKTGIIISNMYYSTPCKAVRIVN